MEVEELVLVLAVASPPRVTDPLTTSKEDWQKLELTVVDVVVVLVVMELQLLLNYFHVTRDQDVDKVAKRRHLQWKILIYTFSSWTQSCSCIVFVSSETLYNLHAMIHGVQHLPNHAL